ncbi:MAG: glycosyl transferase [Chitinophagaceae bacterium]|nr:glycosyl transferase [Chitinophagaceae bacterium]
MRILYAIQGTGNGHLSRARDIIPILQKKGDLDILVSGISSTVELPYPIDYRFRGLSFVFGKKGGIDLLETYKKSNVRKLLKEIKSLPVGKYDVVISDFEPVSSWACHMHNKPCIALSHQSAVMNPRSPQPKHSDIIGNIVLKRYAPATTHYGFHFKSYDENIFTPVIRQQVRALRPANLGHYTVYLPSYSDKRIIKILSECKDESWHVFSRHSEEQYAEKNVIVFPINNEAFIRSLATSEGVLCGAGFETPAEALYLKKKLLVIPMKKQLEQHCNAAALEEMGVPVIKSLKLKHLPAIMDWVRSSKIIEVNYPDTTEQIIDNILEASLASKYQLLPA